MRNYAEETKKRVQFIKDAVVAAHVDGIIFGNSGGKDSALVGILCKMACENTEGIIMPCSLSLIHISEPTRRVDGSRMPSSA